MNLITTLRAAGLTDAEILSGRRHVRYAARLGVEPTVLILDASVTDAEIAACGDNVHLAKLEKIHSLLKGKNKKAPAALLAAVVLAPPAKVRVIKPAVVDKQPRSRDK